MNSPATVGSSTAALTHSGEIHLPGQLILIDGIFEAPDLYKAAVRERLLRDVSDTQAVHRLPITALGFPGLDPDRPDVRPEEGLDPQPIVDALQRARRAGGEVAVLARSAGVQRLIAAARMPDYWPPHRMLLVAPCPCGECVSGSAKLGGWGLGTWLVREWLAVRLYGGLLHSDIVRKAVADRLPSVGTFLASVPADPPGGDKRVWGAQFQRAYSTPRPSRDDWNRLVRRQVLALITENDPALDGAHVARVLSEAGIPVESVRDGHHFPELLIPGLLARLLS